MPEIELKRGQVVLINGFPLRLLGDVMAYSGTQKEVFCSHSEPCGRCWSEIVAQTPKLILKMMSGLNCRECDSMRELFVLKDRANSLGVAEPVGQPRFVFFEEEHADLRDKLATLVNAGCLTCVSAEEPPIYRMTEEFAHRLLRQDVRFPEWFLNEFLNQRVNQHADSAPRQESR